MKLLKPKYFVILGAFLLMMGFFVAAGLLDHKGTVFLVIDSLILVAFPFVIMSWVSLDVRERGAAFGKRWSYAFVYFGLLAFFAYLLKSRGFGRGLLAIAGFFGLLIGVMVCSVIAGVMTLLIFRAPLH